MNVKMELSDINGTTEFVTILPLNAYCYGFRSCGYNFNLFIENFAVNISLTLWVLRVL